MTSKGTALSFWHYLAITSPLIPLCFVVALALTVMHLMQEVPIYRSATKIRLQLPADYTGSEANIESALANEMHLLLSREVKQRGIELSNRTPAELHGNSNVNVRRIPTTTILTVTVTAMDPVLGAEFANALTTAYIEIRAGDAHPFFSPQLLERAYPAARPSTPRKVQSIFIAGLVGSLTGVVVCVLSASLLTLRHPRPPPLPRGQE